MANILLGAVSLGLLWAVMTLGVYITYRVLDIADLTVEGSVALGAAVAARLITAGTPAWPASLAALAAGMTAGLVTGLLHTRLKIPALLSGILTMIALYSINLRVMGKANIPLLRIETVYTRFQNMGLTKSLPTLVVGVMVVTLVSFALYWFFGTELGSAIRATGNNRAMSKAQGIDTDHMIILGLVLSNGLVGFAGALIAQSQSFADVQMGTGSVVIGLASLIIGEVLFGTRSFKNRLVSVSLGAVLYRVIIALVLKAGMDPNDMKLFTAATVAICLALPMFRSYWNTLKKSLTSEREGAHA
ncbi:MAG: ABC transporter permease [Eubacteriales bacterium]|nr:ABC transporter permease [Christensenellaceae bacterium]MEA5064893.1 ABC transporter permease [Eubacteriales bacterium]